MGEFKWPGMLDWRVLGRFRKGSQEGSRGEEKETNTENVTKGAQNRKRLLGAALEARRARKTEEVERALMEAEAPWPRIVWQRAHVTATPTKKCSHQLCSWQQCELKLCALFWAENPTFLAVYEEHDPDRRDALMTRMGISLHTNHITITQYCDQKTRGYQFDDDLSAARRDWMIPGRRVRGQLFPWFKPTFEVVYEHKGCLQAGHSISIVVGGTAMITDIYYRRCDGQYRNVCGQALKGGAGEQITAKAPRDSVPYHLARDFRPFFASNFHTWAQGIARKHDRLFHGPTVQIRPLESEATKGKERAWAPLLEELVTDGIGSSGKETMCKAEEGVQIGGDNEEETVGRYKRAERRGNKAGSKGKARELVDRRGRERERMRHGAKASEIIRTSKRGKPGERSRLRDRT